MPQYFCIYTIKFSDQIKSMLREVPCLLPSRTCRPAGKTSPWRSICSQELSIGGLWDVDISPYPYCSSGYWSDKLRCTLKSTVVSGRLNVIKGLKRTYQIVRTRESWHLMGLESTYANIYLARHHGTSRDTYQPSKRTRQDTTRSAYSDTRFGLDDSCVHP